MKSNHTQIKSYFLKKIIFIFFGFCLSLIFLEVGLRIGGGVLLSLQEYGNKRSLGNRVTYKILCLGESTTQGQYPPFLEESLNKRNIGIRFVVVDKGRGGNCTTVMLGKINSYLDEYHPDMVVAMIGVTDWGERIKYDTTIFSKIMLFVKSLRISKLARLLWFYMETQVKEIGFIKLRKDKQLDLESQTSLFNIVLKEEYFQLENYIKNTSLLKKALELNPKNDRAYAVLGWLYRLQEDDQKAEECFKKAIELNPSNDMASLVLGWLYREQRRYQQLEKYFKGVLELNPRNDRAYAVLGWLYRFQGDKQQAEECLKNAIELNPRNFGATLELVWLYCGQRRFQQAGGCLKKAIKLNPNKLPLLYGALGTIYDEMGQFTSAQAYYIKADQIRLSEYNPKTTYNYNKLREILDKKKIKLVCVQYPMRNIELLKRIFQTNINGIIFVDNEKNFKGALKEGGYRMYFRDIVDGDSGHCTEKGNRLLAENIADTILKEVFGK